MLGKVKTRFSNIWHGRHEIIFSCKQTESDNFQIVIVNTACSYQLCDKIYTLIVENIGLLLYLILVVSDVLIIVSQVFIVVFIIDSAVLMYLLVWCGFCCIWLVFCLSSVWQWSWWHYFHTITILWADILTSPRLTFHPPLLRPRLVPPVFIYSLITILLVLTPLLTTVMDWLTD